MVHTYSLNGYYIAVDGNSGAIHFLDKMAFDMLQGETQFPLLANIKDKLNERYAVAELEEVYHEIEQLHNLGHMARDKTFARFVIHLLHGRA